MTRLHLENVDEARMAGIGGSIGRALFPGAFVALYGGLGAGKTTLTRSIGAAMGIGDVASPTFTIVREHVAGIPLFHFDAYRLSSSDELYDIGFDDYLERNGVIVMEWCELVEDALPRERLSVSIDGSGEMPRSLTIEAVGGRYEAILEELR